MLARTPEFWKSTGFIALVLWPVSLLFRLLVAIRRQLFKRGWLKQIKVDVPVFVVGNITAGGAGKTPLVIELAKHFQARGITAGILCGGYGGSARGGEPITVDAQTDANIAGDEAVVIARQTDLPVVVAKDRAAGAKLLQSLLESLTHSAKSSKRVCIICDDGLQHYRLYRDTELAVIDSVYQFGNGLMLPAGPLREPVKRLGHVDLVCYTGEEHAAPGYRLNADELVNVLSDDRISIKKFKPRQVRAVAGIAYPEKFFKMLRSHGFEVTECALPDHHRFDQSTLQFPDDLPIIMTEKDSVKCREFAPEHAWYLPVTAVPDKALREQFEQWADAINE